MKSLKYILVLVFCVGMMNKGTAQTIDVTFRYYANPEAQRAFVPGEFNEWGSNNSGQIAIDNESLMEKDQEHGFWYKTIALQVGGGDQTNNGASGYAYKFHEQYNAAGTDWQWFTDPLNPIAIGQNNDSFLEVTHPLIFQMQPSASEIVGNEGEIWATIASIDGDPVDVTASQFYINGTVAGNLSSFYDAEQQLFHITDLSQIDLAIGTNEIRFEVVTNGNATKSDSTTFVYLPEVDPVGEVRPAGLQDGITYNGSAGTSVSFSLFAPEKDYVFLVGDFNDWTPSEEYLLKKDSLKADSVWHWITLDEFTPGEEVAFQYLVEGEQRIADPYSELVLDPNNDSYIPEETYPNLKAYPEGKTTGTVSVIQPGKEAYQWQVTDFEKPEKDELVIYELLIRDFIEAQNFQTLTDTLDYLDNLGVNAIELMPVSEFDGNNSWGYNPSFHLALDKYYGTEHAFKRFIDEAHSRGIAVILDVVMNHATGLNPFYQLYGNDDDFYFNSEARHAYNVFNDFDHSYSGTQYYTKRMIEHWISEYKIDGFRWDLTKGFTQNCSGGNANCTNQPQQDRIEILQKYADYQWAVDPNFYVIFEHLGTEAEESEWANYRVHEGKGIMLWGKMNDPYNEATMGYNENGKSNLYGVLSESRTSFRQRHLVGYMESHDEQWLMFKNLNFGNSSGDYDITELGTALNRQKLAGAFFYLLPGPKMMWQFGELGYGGGPGECLKPGGDGSDGDCLPSDPWRVGEKPIRWEYYKDEGRKNLYKVWSYLINLRRSSPAFTNPAASNFDNLSGATKYFTLQHEDTDVLVIGNFGVTETSLTAPFPSAGEWHDYFNGGSLTITENSSYPVTLGPGEFKIYTTKQFESPAEEDLFTSNEREDNSDSPKSFKLNQNYPNPFNPSTVISYQLAEGSDVTLTVFDMLGREVATLVNERKSSGSYQVNFDASALSSGMYIYRLQAGSKVFTQKMMLIK